MARRASPRKDQFAELLSQGLELWQIGMRMGLTRNGVAGYMNRICNDLGPQARG